MPHDVFISYSTPDVHATQEIVQVLEAAGIRCWIANRDIMPGTPNWAGDIERAIRQSKAMVLVVSPSFNESVQTPKEIILGIDERAFILPIRIAEFQPWGHLRYFLADRQWIDATGSHLQQRLDLVVRVLRYVLDRAPASFADPVPAGASQFEGLTPAKALGVLPLGADLKLELWQPMRLHNDQPSLWLQAYNALVPMTGRDQEADELLHLLRASGPFRWRVCFGEAGMGKTRLAIEFARRSLSEGWHAGFLSSGNLKAFVSSDLLGTWRPCVPTFVVVDYAASKVGDLRRLFEHFSTLEAEALQDPRGEGAPPPVRVLLLERHVDESRGWLKELLSAGESATGDLLRNTCYAGVVQLQPPGGEAARGSGPINSTRQIIEDTFSSWATITGRQAPVLPDFDEKDWRSIQLRTGNRPLYLQMAALHACERGSAEHLPSWGRGELLKAAVSRERRYVQKECDGHSELCQAVEHVTAILCLAGAGASRGRQWLRVVEEELRSICLTSVSPHQVELRRRAIFTEQLAGSSDAETGVIQPDIVSEGYAAQVLHGEEGGPPIETLKQVLRLSGVKAWANLVRMAQDLLGLEKHLFESSDPESIGLWLPPLLEERPTEELRELLHVVPERSVSLHGFALLVSEHLLGRIPAAQTRDRAECLLVLGTHRCRLAGLDRQAQERAIGELQQAIELFAALPLDDAESGCRLDLAKAHRLLGNAHSYLGRNAEAVRNSWIAARLSAGESLESLAPPATPDDFRVDQVPIPAGLEAMAEYAKNLNCLAIDLMGLSRGSQALAAAARATEVGEHLVSHNWKQYAPDLARYLNNLSLAQAEGKDVAAAIRSSCRSAEIRSEFARENPDEYAQPLSLTLANLVSLEYSQNNVAAAREATEQLVTVYEDLSARNPASYRRDLAQSLHNIGYLCDKSGSRAEGIAHTAKAIEIREELLESDPDSIALGLAWSHNDVGHMYREQGEFPSARSHLERAYALRLRWVEADPERHLPELVSSASSMARLCRQMNDREAEAVWLQRVVAHARNSVVPEADQAMALHDLAVSLGALGRTAEAGVAAGQAAALFKELFAACSFETNGRQWAGAGCNLCSALAMQGDWTNSEAVAQETICTATSILSRIDAGDEESSFVYGAMLNNLGHAQYRRGEMLGRADLVRGGLETLRRSVRQHQEHDRPGAAQETQELAALAEKALERLTR
jgi:tetratricopeptide (TPR) repeat protein